MGTVRLADFLLVGPAEDLDTEYVNSKPNNVFLLGKKDYKQIPAYIDLDVTFIPFQKDETARFADPIKLYEYFTLGKPVVTTPLEQSMRFHDGRKMVVAQTKQEFIEGVEFFLTKDNKT